jgi:hypothetical protein
MRLLLLLAALAAFPAHADLYRWIERETGTVKYSSYPPPWFGDREKELRAPAVEVIRYQGPVPAPSEPAAAKPSSGAALLVALEAQWKALTQFFSSLPPGTDFARAGAGIQQQLEVYQAVSAELDRMDPAGAARRKAQEAGILETLRAGLQAQFSIKPPAR